IWSFYPKYAWESASKYYVVLRSWLQIDAAARRIRKDPNRHFYVDQALTEVTDDETQSLELFTHTDDARHALQHAAKAAQWPGAPVRASVASPPISDGAMPLDEVRQ